MEIRMEDQKNSAPSWIPDSVVPVETRYKRCIGIGRLTDRKGIGLSWGWEGPQERGNLAPYQGLAEYIRTEERVGAVAPLNRLIQGWEGNKEVEMEDKEERENLKLESVGKLSMPHLELYIKEN